MMRKPHGGMRSKTARSHKLRSPAARLAVALRPEKVHIDTISSTPPTDDNCFAGRVTEVGYLGGVSIYKVRLEDGTVMKAAVANVARLIDPPIGPDQEVVLSWAPGAAVVLPG